MSNNKLELLWNEISQPVDSHEEDLLKSIAKHLEFSLCKNQYTTTDHDIYQALVLSIRDRLVEHWNETQQNYFRKNPKRVYYLSLEYLIGQCLRNNLINLGIYSVCQNVLEHIGYSMEDIEKLEHDAGLGNGGLGRLAACFLDSMSTLQLPAYGYGIRYEYGIFEQGINEHGQQVEHPENWLSDGYFWEIPRWDKRYPVNFYGSVRQSTDAQGNIRYEWVNTETIYAMAHDIPIVGYQNKTVNNLRLWAAKASHDFDFQLFNQGDYMKAVEEKQKSETLSKVLYPNDKGFSGKELRLKQQYFFVAASLQDILRRYKKQHDTFDAFADETAIQLNDTHPSIAIVELMRIFLDEEGMEWDQAWSICQKTFAYTNHTVLPEALEKWSVELLGHLLPRHLQIIYDINHQFLEEVKQKHAGNMELLSRVSLIEEGPSKQVRMPYLSIVGSHITNGVSSCHSELLTQTVFQDFHELYPDRFQNKTNGITPRRWLKITNPELSDLITKTIGDSWICSLDDLKQLNAHVEDETFLQQWRQVKQQKKQQLAQWIQQNLSQTVNPNSIFDIQVKRIHEYKRQLMNVLYAITQYQKIKKDPSCVKVPRTIIFSGKAAPGYDMAKLIIRLIHDVARTIQKDPEVSQWLQVVFLPNYRVSLAEKIIPASDVSQHISTAGTEASGTSNMKFCLNGGIIVGTLDGANIEIRESVGPENMFIFGLNTDEVKQVKAQGYNPRVPYQQCQEVREALEMVNEGYFNTEHPHLYHDIYNSLTYDDHYLLLADFESYLQCQTRVEQAYLDQKAWTQMSIRNTANMGYFSSDRTIQEYADDIWGATPVAPK